MKNLNKEKKRIIIYCEQVLRDAELEAEKESISLIEAFKKLWKHQMRKIQKDEDDIDLDAYEDELM
jgi:hypothetical protein